MLTELEAFQEHYGHLRVEEERNGYPALADWWLSIQGRLETLLYDQILSLDNLGFFDRLDQRWLDRYAQLRHFKEITGHCNVPVVCNENPALGNWVAAQRQRKKTAKMAAWRWKLLTDLGFCLRSPWAGILGKWDEFIKRITSYRNRFGNCNVPRNWSEDRKLAHWVRHLRSPWKPLDPDKMRQLDALGFDWRPHDTTWETRVRELKEFKEQHGHCRVPNKAGKLGIWVINVRSKKETLSRAKIHMLDEIGFDWTPRGKVRDGSHKRTCSLSNQTRPLTPDHG